MNYQESAGWRIMTLVKYAMSSLFAPLARASKTGLRGNSDNSCPFCSFSSRANYFVRSILLFHYRCAMWCHSGKLGQKWELKLRLVEILRAYFKSWIHYRPWTDARVNYTHENAGRKKLSVWLVIFMFILNYLTLYLATVRWVNVNSNKISRALCSRQPSLNADMDLSPAIAFCIFRRVSW